LLEIIVREWPNAGLMMGSLSGLSLAQAPTDEERKQAREAGIAQPVEIDGALYMPRGQTLAGTASDVTMRVNAILRAIDDIARDPKAWIRERVDGRGRGLWRAAVRGDHVGFTNGPVFVSVIELS